MRTVLGQFVTAQQVRDRIWPVGVSLTISLDASELEAFQRRLEAGLLERLPQGLRGRLLGILDSGGLDDCITCGSAALSAGHYVARLGFTGDLQIIAAALGALEADLSRRSIG